MLSKAVIFSALLLILLVGCSSKNHLAPNLCLKENGLFSPEDISAVHLRYFSENIQLFEVGHYLSGVYVSKEGERIYTSVYTGEKTDSLLHSLTEASDERKRFGEKMFWLNTSNQLFLFSLNTLVLIDYPPSKEEMIIPDQDGSEFFQLCD